MVTAESLAMTSQSGLPLLDGEGGPREAWWVGWSHTHRLSHGVLLADTFAHVFAQAYQSLTPDFAFAFRSTLAAAVSFPSVSPPGSNRFMHGAGSQMGGAAHNRPGFGSVARPGEGFPAGRLRNPIVPRPCGLITKLTRGRTASGCCPPNGGNRREDEAGADAAGASAWVATAPIAHIAAADLPLVLHRFNPSRS